MTVPGRQDDRTNAVIADPPRGAAPMVRHCRRARPGFNLVETIVAAVVLSGTVVTVGAISSRSLVATRLNRQYETAASLLDRQMTVIEYAGVDQLVDAGRMEGRMDDIPPGYQWTATAKYEGIDSLYTVTVTVTWVEQGRQYSLSAETQFNGTSMVVLDESGQTQTTGTQPGSSR